MSKDSPAKYYQDIKERLQKKACERYQSLSKKENVTKMYRKMKNKSWLIMEKILENEK